ncbi:MAG: hypothetical protein DRJ13_02035 [Bacteroidetes bacterium]|nr:MAG: hypothetical protein DRJ13_02035 [Bacteroidota bacterium]
MALANSWSGLVGAEAIEKPSEVANTERIKPPSVFISCKISSNVSGVFPPSRGALSVTLVS